VLRPAAHPRKIKLADALRAFCRVDERRQALHKPDHQYFLHGLTADYETPCARIAWPADRRISTVLLLGASHSAFVLIELPIARRDAPASPDRPVSNSYRPHRRCRRDRTLTRRWTSLPHPMTWPRQIGGWSTRRRLATTSPLSANHHLARIELVDPSELFNTLRQGRRRAHEPGYNSQAFRLTPDYAVACSFSATRERDHRKDCWSMYAARGHIDHGLATAIDIAEVVRNARLE